MICLLGRSIVRFVSKYAENKDVLLLSKTAVGAHE